MNNFQKSAQADEKCPKCKSVKIFLYGGGWDNDREFCSNRECDYEVEYDTTTCSEEE